ncbi:PEBP family protein [Vibrio europaeus]|uniref:PEBP family protein n=1 Tax=Vibrio europaeus TaxID=300876 RepID=A0A178J6S1_9VIBR|nr:PEBP family protein [Vibrio europaeus]MDC5705279.1 PEBP family protein [Vibrio europaeus]MDC5710558.1 PEBP family protein [Vibrio europaeus]MDC5715648.1 PEBP family protein [Vibrio europaeus]MDC5719809.1 PEBP family protein [Vibrio europaeus]MDC5724303.1 PEBP family protein [Vibrio europaeus]
MLKNSRFYSALVISALALTTPYANSSELVKVQADVWADNWFAMYIEEDMIAQDSVSIDTERSFNAETFQFATQLPVTVSFVIKDYKQDDTGLEYIGTDKQQMGDGGFIAQFVSVEHNKTLLVSNQAWRCFPVHIAPIDKRCEKSLTPQRDCKSDITPEPLGWKAPAFDDNGWPNAEEFSERKVKPKEGYKQIRWHSSAKLIWTTDLETDNTILCRATLTSGEI